MRRYMHTFSQSYAANSDMEFNQLPSLYYYRNHLWHFSVVVLVLESSAGGYVGSLRTPGVPPMAVVLASSTGLVLVLASSS
jgi:hypothetical protein